MIACLSRTSRAWAHCSVFRSYASFASKKIFEPKHKPTSLTSGTVANFFNYQKPHPTAMRLVLNNNQSANEQRAFCSTARLQRKFTISRAIPVSQKQYVVLDMAEENEKSLLPLIRMGNHLMLQGVPGSGKTTQTLKAMDQLKEDFLCIYVNLQFVQRNNFWPSLGKALVNKVQHPTKVNSQEEFLQMFRVHHRFHSEKVVLFIDGFDHLYKVPENEREEFLVALQVCKNMSSCLHSVVAIGPYSINNLGLDTATGFNIAEPVKFWTQDQVSKLLHQHDTSISDEVIKDIHQRTAGHAGLVCMCAKSITELDPQMATNYNLWIQFANTKLITSIMKDWHTMSRMTHHLALTDSDTAGRLKEEEVDMAVKARKFLRKVMAGGLKPIQLNMRKTIKLAEYLVNEGAMTSVNCNTFKVPSPLLYTLLSYDVLSVDQPKVPDEHPPYFLDQNYIPTILSQIRSCFDKKTMAKLYHHAYKKCHIPLVHKKKHAPLESLYLAEVYSILRAWLPSCVTILPQVNVQGSHCNLLLYQGEQKYLLEFVSYASPEDLKAHFKQVHDYAVQLGAQQAWLVHFLEWNIFDSTPASHEEYPNVNVMRMSTCDTNPFFVWKTVYPTEIKSYISLP